MTVAAAEQTTAARRGGLARSRRNEALALVLPSLVPVVVLSILPIVAGLLYAFTDSKLLTQGLPNFVGLANFDKVFANSAFWQSFGIGAVWTVSVTALQVVLGLALALLLNTDLKFRGIVRVLAVIPWAMPPVVVAIMWQSIYSPTHGPLNWLIGALGGPSDINWLGSFSLALPAVIVVGVWTGIPQNTISLLAGLQQIPSELLEAAMVDGARTWSRFVHVVLPSLRPVIVAIASLSFIWNFNSFGIVYVMTAGGPGGRTLLPMLFVYIQAFENGNTGIAAAMTVVILVLLVLVLALASLGRLGRRRADA
ncbi:sugar ABC transporter permease [Gryllotalpicola koreensis]|uniref:Sugar ABC transporter permease n=1 Tax=Gryllotalpicola koreensis TaxID=993086 RepID=A0ABP8A023_9MICO